jgi:hypothetical protein
VTEMNPVKIGLPSISDEELEQLAEKCEDHVTQYILKKVPEKSIENLFVSCVLTMEDGQLDVEFQVDIDQSYDTGQSLDDLLEEAGEIGADWLEEQLSEMKKR